MKPSDDDVLYHLLNYDQAEQHDLVMQEAAEFNDCWAQSNEDGWFYPDDVD